MFVWHRIATVVPKENWCQFGRFDFGFYDIGFWIFFQFGGVFSDKDLVQKTLYNFPTLQLFDPDSYQDVQRNAMEFFNF